MQPAPEFPFGHAGPEFVVHALNAGLTGLHGPVHEFEFILTLDLARFLHARLPIAQYNAGSFEQGKALAAGCVDGKDRRLAALAPQFCAQFIGPGNGPLAGPTPAGEVAPVYGLPNLVHEAVPGMQVSAVVKFPEQGGSFGKHERIARRVVHGPYLHVRRIRRVADIDGIVEQYCVAAEALQLFSNALRTIPTGGPLHPTTDRVLIQRFRIGRPVRHGTQHGLPFSAERPVPPEVP